LPNVNLELEHVLLSLKDIERRVITTYFLLDAPDTQRRVITTDFLLDAPDTHSRYPTYKQTRLATDIVSEPNNIGRILRRSIKKLRQLALSENLRPFIVGELHTDPEAPWIVPHKITRRPQRKGDRALADLQRIMKELTRP
jgi:hypothetical protein